MIKVPDVLTQTDKLSKLIYDFWVNTLITDRIVNENEIGKWDTIDEQYRRNFMQSISLHVTEAVKRLKEDIEYEATMGVEVGQPQENNAYTCYACGAVAVSKPGNVCRSCNRE